METSKVPQSTKMGTLRQEDGKTHAFTHFAIFETFQLASLVIVTLMSYLYDLQDKHLTQINLLSVQTSMSKTPLSPQVIMPLAAFL